MGKTAAPEVKYKGITRKKNRNTKPQAIATITARNGLGLEGNVNTMGALQGSGPNPKNAKLTCDIYVPIFEMPPLYYLTDQPVKDSSGNVSTNNNLT